MRPSGRNGAVKSCRPGSDRVERPSGTARARRQDRRRVRRTTALYLLSSLFASGAAAPAEDPPPPKRSAAPSPGVGAPSPGDDVFDPAPVLRLKIELSQEAVEELRGQSRGPQKNRPYVKGTVHEGGKEYRDVGVRLKGSIGSFRPLDSKPGLSLKFNRFVPAQRFHGLRKIILDTSVQDSTYLSDLIGNGLFRAGGVPAPRNGFAVVELNGRRLGFYVVSEAVTEDFLARWFGDTGGNLYEGPGDVSSERLDVDSHGGKSDHTDLRRLVEATRVRDSAQRLERIREVLDLERFMSF